ncbi:MAG: Glutamyl-tRNA reductase [Verrucomicrobia subdivision 3 bacterium]|nr:Glutamyl-tRNA reductase [Limisphaerales bacterium]MCS1415079.1 Glutamyl-tRNA reductase [Limisphaerales bacterium]
MSLLVIGLSHHTSPVSLREQLAITEHQLPEAMEDLRSEVEIEEMVVLSTCNRVELYVAHDNPDTELAAALIQKFADNRNFNGELGDAIYTHIGRQGVEHLFRVASGLDSMVLGETEILGQLKQAYQTALHHRHTGRRLNKTFQKAFQVAKQIRSKTNIQRGPTSVASAAVELAERIFDGLKNHQVMVLGAGGTSEKVARALSSRGASSVIVSNRSHEKAVRLATELEGRAIHFKELVAEFPEIDIVISSTSAPHYLLDRTQLMALLKNRPARPLLLIDIAVPRDIDPSVGFLDNVYLYNVDDLQAIANDHLKQRQKEIARCEMIIKNRVDEILAALVPWTLDRRQQPRIWTRA